MQLQYSEVHDSILSQISSLELLVQDICNMAFCHNIGINAIKKKITQKHYDKCWRQRNNLSQSYGGIKRQIN